MVKLSVTQTAVALTQTALFVASSQRPHFLRTQQFTGLFNVHMFKTTPSIPIPPLLFHRIRLSSESYEPLDDLHSSVFHHQLYALINELMRQKGLIWQELLGFCPVSCSALLGFLFLQRYFLIKIHKPYIFFTERGVSQLE